DPLPRPGHVPHARRGGRRRQDRGGPGGRPTPGAPPGADRRLRVPPPGDPALLRGLQGSRARQERRGGALGGPQRRGGGDPPLLRARRRHRARQRVHPTVSPRARERALPRPRTEGRSPRGPTLRAACAPRPRGVQPSSAPRPSASTPSRTAPCATISTIASTTACARERAPSPPSTARSPNSSSRMTRSFPARAATRRRTYRESCLLSRLGRSPPPPLSTAFHCI